MARMLLVAAPLALLAACTSEAEIAAEMQRALGGANQALVGVLLSAEVMHQVAAPPDATLRHDPSGCGCPCTEKLGSGLPYLLTLDYAQAGCLPDSLLLPASLAGHAIIEYDGESCEITWDGLAFAMEHEVAGDLTGPASASEVSPTGTLTVGPWTATLDLDLAIGADALVIDGEVSSKAPGDEEARTIRFDGVRLPREAILGQCPTPDDGEAILLHPKNENQDVVVRFAHVPQRDGGGEVTVVRDDRVSEPTDWCAYASELW